MQVVHFLSSHKMARSILRNVFLKEDKETDSLMVLGITPQILGPEYQSECLP